MNTIDKTMQEKMNAELLELKNLESAGTIQDDQKARLTELIIWEKEEADKTALMNKMKKDAETALAQKEHFRTKFEKEEAARIASERERGISGNSKPLEVEDFIGISASLEGLDQREKEFLANQHKLTGKPLADIRKDEDFLLWQSAHQAKVEKEKLALKPNSTQVTDDTPVGLEKKLQDPNLSMAEKEKLLTEAGLYKSPKPRTDVRNIGNLR